MGNHHRLRILMIGVLVSVACREQTKESALLPLLGPRHITQNGDTLYHKIAPFRFQNQNGTWITHRDTKGRIYVANFFFTACPSICPATMAHMKRVYDHYASSDLLILSHSVDPRRDSILALKAYADALNIEADKGWHLLTGADSLIYALAQSSYWSAAQAKSEAPGGFIHSNMFVLVDGKGHIRGVYDGLSANEVEALITDIARLSSLKQ